MGDNTRARTTRDLLGYWVRVELRTTTQLSRAVKAQVVEADARRLQGDAR